MPLHNKAELFLCKSRRNATAPCRHRTRLRLTLPMPYTRHLTMPMLYGAKRHSTRRDSSMPAHHQAVQCHYFAFRYAAMTQQGILYRTLPQPYPTLLFFCFHHSPLPLPCHATLCLCRTDFTAPYQSLTEPNQRNTATPKPNSPKRDLALPKLHTSKHSKLNCAPAALWITSPLPCFAHKTKLNLWFTPQCQNSTQGYYALTMSDYAIP